MVSVRECWGAGCRALAAVSPAVHGRLALVVGRRWQASCTSSFAQPLLKVVHIAFEVPPCPLSRLYITCLSVHDAPGVLPCWRLPSLMQGPASHAMYAPCCCCCRWPLPMEAPCQARWVCMCRFNSSRCSCAVAVGLAVQGCLIVSYVVEVA